VRILSLADLERHAEAATAWQQAREAGLELGFEVHAYVYRDVPACGTAS